MSQPQFSDQDAELLKAAEIAFNRSRHYQWNGQKITWAFEHDWLFESILAGSELPPKLQYMAAMWVGSIETVEEMDAINSTWRTNPSKVVNAIKDFASQFHPRGDEVAEAIKVTELLMSDKKASSNEVEQDDTAAQKGGSKSPKKSHTAAATATTSTRQPG